MVDLWKMTGNTKVKIMLTIKAEIQKEKLRQDGTYNVKIRFTKGKQVKRISTDLFVKQEELTSTLKFKEGSSIQQETDRLVLHYRTLFSDLGIDSNDYSLDGIVNFLLNKDKINERIDFIQFAKSWIEQSHIKGKNNYATTINSIIRYNGKDELDMKFINSEYVNKYKEYLIQEKEKRVDHLKDKIERQLDIINSIFENPEKINCVEEYANPFESGNFTNLLRLAENLKK